jgi:choline dehydrogenase-like flavoprotein
MSATSYGGACTSGESSAKGVGGSTVHFAMVSLRFRPECFKSRSVLGYGADWPLDWREMWHYYTKAEKALSISRPLSYPGARSARATPIARTSLTARRSCWPAARKR